MPVEFIRAATMIHGELPTCSQVEALDILGDVYDAMCSTDCCVWEIVIFGRGAPVDRWTLWVQFKRPATADEEWEEQTERTVSCTVEKRFLGMKLYDGSPLLTLVEPLRARNIIRRHQETAEQVFWESQFIRYHGLSFLPYCDGKLQHVDERHWILLLLHIDEYTLYRTAKSEKARDETWNRIRLSNRGQSISQRILAAIDAAGGPDGLLD